MFQLLGLGIDIVSKKRAEQFFIHHRSRISEKLLSPAEKRKWSSRKLQGSGFAKIFAAKEAFFKSLGEAWLGLDGFRSMEIELAGKNHFIARTVRSSRYGIKQAKGTFFESDRYVGAQVMRWKKDYR